MCVCVCVGGGGGGGGRGAIYRLKLCKLQNFSISANIRDYISK